MNTQTKNEIKVRGLNHADYIRNAYEWYTGKQQQMTHEQAMQAAQAAWLFDLRRVEDLNKKDN